MNTPTQPRGLTLVLAALGCISAGCGLFQRKPPAPPIVIIQQPPIILQEPAATPMPIPPPHVPSSATLPAMSPPPIAAPPAPPPKRTASTAGTPAKPNEAPPAADTGDGPTPQLTTALTPAEQAASRRSTTAILQQADRNLAALNRKALSPDAAATRAQASEYARQARDALTQGDLVRAQNLAQKAQSLIRFLLGGGL